MIKRLEHIYNYLHSKLHTVFLGQMIETNGKPSVL